MEKKWLKARKKATTAMDVEEDEGASGMFAVKQKKKVKKMKKTKTMRRAKEKKMKKKQGSMDIIEDYKQTLGISYLDA